MRQFTIATIFSIFSLLSCQSNSTAPAKEVVAEVKGKYLYLIDIQDAMPKGLNDKDSAQFARQFIQNWVSDELMYSIARKNIPDEEKIDAMVEEYRHQLITNEYQRYLIEEKLSSEISDEEISEYREAHKAQMVLKTNQIKGLFLKIPLNAPKHDQLHTWMTLKKPDYLEKIDKYSIQHAVAYENFVNRWVDFDAIMANIPYSISNPSVFLKQNRQLQVSDTAYFYMLAIQEVATAGTPLPDELANEEARSRLVAERKVNYLVKFRSDLLQKALKDNDVVIKKQ